MYLPFSIMKYYSDYCYSDYDCDYMYTYRICTCAYTRSSRVHKVQRYEVQHLMLGSLLGFVTSMRVEG